MHCSASDGLPDQLPTESVIVSGGWVGEFMRLLPGIQVEVELTSGGIDRRRGLDVVKPPRAPAGFQRCARADDVESRQLSPAPDILPSMQWPLKPEEPVEAPLIQYTLMDGAKWHFSTRMLPCSESHLLVNNNSVARSGHCRRRLSSMCGPFAGPTVEPGQTLRVRSTLRCPTSSTAL